ncbi:MAG: PepSY domain-containing protein [Clostridia bacterium]|nr:PepSY domain-containing protein [Clostridia bacterium]
MKNKLFKKLFAITLSLALAFSLTGCLPDVHIHTGGESSTDSTTATESDLVVSTDEKTESNTESKSEVQTDVASSEKTESTPKNPSSTPSQSTNSKDSGSSTISSSKAKSIALKDAGVKESEIYDFEIELDRDNGTLHYDVSFEKDGRDYDYEINAKTGKIISVEKPNMTSSEAKISKSKAKSTALNHAGVKENEISLYKIELEKDDGVWKYEISFNVGNVEYDYTINAENGKIIEAEKDIDD